MRDLGINHLCITNHGEFFIHEEEIVGVFEYAEAHNRFQKDKNELDEIRSKYPDMDIRFGIELQYQPECHDDIKKLMNELPFDFALGSVHFIDNIIISGGKNAGQAFEKMDEETAYNKYFNSMLEWVELAYFDVVAHFDIIKKFGVNYYGPFQPEKYKTIIQKIIQSMKEKGIGMELNAATLHKRCNEIMPHPQILKWCLEAGIETFTLGTDAHNLETAGKLIPEALQIAKDVGITHLSTFKNRQPVRHEIQSAE